MPYAWPNCGSTRPPTGRPERRRRPHGAGGNGSRRRAERGGGAARGSGPDRLAETRRTWRRLVEPSAEHAVGALSDAVPDEAKQMAGPLMGFLGQAGGAMFGQQIGRALGELSTEVLSTTDVGLPLWPEGVAVVVPRHVKAFGAG